MPSKDSPTVLSYDQLMDGYVETVENSMRFAGAVVPILHEYPDKALALAQLGQEEIGRSLTLLAGFHLARDPAAWGWFWAGWNNHQLKAHRAYLYEIISSLRIELSSPEGRRYAGEPLRSTMSKEKESGLYVDFDDKRGRFTSPAREVSLFDAVARTTTLTYLAATADCVRRALVHADSSFRFVAFSEIAFRICSEELYQQDMPAIIGEFRGRSADHESLVADLDTALAGNADFFRSIRPAKSDRDDEIK